MAAGRSRGFGMLLGAALAAALEVAAQDGALYQDAFPTNGCTLVRRGANGFFLPIYLGRCLLLEGVENSRTNLLWIKVLGQRELVNGVRCAVVREALWTNDDLAQVTWQYYSVCQEHKSIYHLGADRVVYTNGLPMDAGGSWRAGAGGAAAGLMMPGEPVVGARYYQDLAPGVSSNRAEHVSRGATVVTPAGTFENCLQVVETTPLAPAARTVKCYAPGVGLVQSGSLLLVAHGCHLEPEEDGDAVPVDSD